MSESIFDSPMKCQRKSDAAMVTVKVLKTNWQGKDQLDERLADLQNDWEIGLLY